MMEHVLDKALEIPEIERVLVVTNNKFAGQFEEWAGQYAAKQKKARPIRIINDRSTSDTDKLGAIGDIRLVVEQEKIAGDLMVVAGDNLFSESLKDFGAFCLKTRKPALGVYDVKDLEAAKKYGCVSVDAQNKLTFFEEKPAQPKSSLIAMALYYYPADVVKLIDTYVKEGNNPDQPGRFVQWLYKRTDVYACRVPGQWYDIGSKETLEEADRIFSR